MITNFASVIKKHLAK